MCGMHAGSEKGVDVHLLCSADHSQLIKKNFQYMRRFFNMSSSTPFCTPSTQTILDMAIIRAQFDNRNASSAIKRTLGDARVGKLSLNPAFSIMWSAYAATYLVSESFQ